MASIPIIVAAIPVAVDLLKTEIIPLLVKWVDHIVGGKTAANPTVGTSIKFPLVETAVSGLAAALVAIGKATPSSAATLQGAIQDVFNSLQAAGLLTGFSTVVTSAPGAAIAKASPPAAFDGTNLLSQVLSLIATELGPKAK